MNDLLTLPEIAKQLRKSKKTTYCYVETGIIPEKFIIRIGRTIHMRLADLNTFIESCRGK